MKAENIIINAVKSGVHLYLKDGRLAYKLNKGSFPDDIKAMVVANKDLVIEHLELQLTQSNLDRTVQAYPRESQTLPTSFSQQRLWFIDHLKGGSPEYNMPVALTVKGELSLPVVERVFQRIIARHEVLRTNYYDEAGVVYQYIHEPENVAFSVVYQDLRSLQGEAQQAQIKARISEVITTAFNLAEDLLLKVLYLATGEDTGVLLFNMHHIASDGWSMQVLTNEFVRLYEAYSQGEAEPLPQLALQYGDYAQWQRTHITDTVLDKQLSYWLAQLDEAPAVHNLTLDYPRPAEKQYHGAQVVSAFSAQTADALLAAAKRHQLTPFMLLHGALSLVLSRHSNSHDIIMGTPVANRLQAELAPLIGFFVNTLVLRVNTQHDSLAEYYAHVRATHLAGQSHQDVPFEQLVEKLKVPRSRAHGPLFQIMVTTNTDYGLHEHQPLQLAGIEVAPYQSDIVQAKFDLKVDLAIDEQGGGVSWSYDTSLFSEAHIEQLSTHLQQLLEALADTRGEWDIALSQLDMLSAKEVRQLVHECNARSDNATQAWGNIVSHFTAQAQRQSMQTAVVCGDSKMSYGELDRQSNQLARYLMTRHHVQRGTLVGLCMDRSIEMVVSILAILKAGGGYVPLDPHYPESRLRYMATDTGMSLLLSQQRLKSALPDLPVEVVAVDEIAQDWQCLAATDVDVAITGSDVAYVIYTSGSTGQPKGVLTPHQGVTRLVIEQSFMTLNSDTVMMHCANIAFDAATLELWGPLLNGGQCVLYRPPYLSPAELNKELEQHNVNSLWLTAGFFREWSYHVPTVTSLRQLLAGGDSLDLDAIKRIQQIQPELTLINGYGPTENTTFSTTYTFPQAYQEERVPIGYRLDSDEIYILDGHQQLVPQGCIGELFVGGPGLALGYLNQPELTAERFVENPFYDEAQAGSSRRLYRTGDLVRYLPDGRIEFIGRVDSQVKIRGFRIELGEVEACLHAASSVASALAIVKDIAGEKQLIGYVQRQSGLDIDESSWLQALKAELQQDLPEHMIPSILIAVDEWPLTANGKVDRRALPSADVGCLQGEYVSPEGDIEQQLTGIWAQLLGIKAAEISATANFFTLGGHSLLTIRLVSEIQRCYGVDISLQQVFNAKDLRSLANDIEQSEQGQVLPAVQAYPRESQTLPTSFSQQRLWFIDHLKGGSPEYNMPVALTVKGELSLPVVERVFQRIIARHEVLRTNYYDEAGVVYQYIHEPENVAFSVVYQDLRSLQGEAQQAQIKARISEVITTAFNLAEDLLLKVLYLATGEDTGVLLFNMHHIASDGWSMQVLTNEFVRLYEAYSQGEAEPLPQLALQYGDYAQWQRTHITDTVLDKQLSYWLAQLDEAPAVHNLTLDYPRPAEKQYHGAQVVSAFSAQTADALLAAAKRHQLTPFMLLHGALSLVLSRHSNSHDIIMGTPVANRLQAELAPLIGFFVNTLVLRVNTQHDSLAEYYAHVRATHLAGQSHQDVPFEQLVEKLKVPRSRAHGPLFQIMVTTNTDYGLHEHQPLQLAGIEVAPYQSDIVQAKFDLKVDLAIDEQGGGVSWSYDTSLFSEAHIEQLSTHLQQLLEALADTRGEWDIALSQLDMLSAKEVRQLVHECNARSDNATQAWGNIVSHFTAQAQRQSTQTAVVCGDSKMSYGELDRQSNQLARYLMTRHHVQRGTLVGLCMDRSIEMVVSILAILKAGGGYVPLDPHYPESRLRYMATDTGMSLLLSQQRLKSTLPDLPVEVVAVDEIAQDWQCLAATDVDVAITGSDVAYVIYTSGSTGQPKGVLTPHQGLSNFYTGFLAQGEVLSQGMGDAWLWLSSYVFDASLKGLCLLADGVKLVIPSKAQILAPLELSKLIKQHDIQVVNATPQLLGALLSEPTLPAVDVISSGDLIGAGLLKRLQQFVQKHKRVLLNAYGPTETTVNTHFAELTHSDREVIGRGMHNVSSYILSSAFELVPQGCIGELFVGGPGLALGYLNQPELTAERFVENPFYDEAQAGSSRRLYRTGDLVRYLPDGRIEFIGRVDSQVKIRGFRIELGEVEACLHAASSVASALAIVKDIAGEKQLIGYVQRQSGLDIDESSWLQALKAELQQDLPEHMIPSILIAVDEWPLTANGKVDRRALPSADVGCLQGEYVSPEGDIEQQLAGIWAQLLGIKAAEISATANFFTLGGHSLLTIRLVSEIQRCYGVDISLQQVFNAKDLRSLANDIEQSEQGQVLPAVQAYPRESQTLPTSFSQQRLWFIDHLKGGSPEYNMPVALTVKGELSLPVVERVFQRIIARHEVLRTNYYDEAGVVYQYIHEPENVAFSVVYQDLRSLQGEAQQAQIKARISEVITTAFNLAEDLLLKVLYLATGEDTGVLLFNMHHIASDGWSMQVLTNEFVRLYEAYSQGEAEPLPQLALQYGDYAQWQRTHITDTVLDKQLSYWLAQLDEAPAVHNLTLDYPRPAEKQYHGAQVVSAFSAQTADALLAAAKRHQLTPFMLLHGALSLVLSRHSNSHDIIMGTPVANRLQAELAPLIGFFVNTLVLRVNTQHDSLAEYYAHVRATHLAGQSHQDVPFEQLVEKLKVPRSRAHGPLFQIMVTTNTDYGLHEHQPLQLAGIEVAPYQSDIVQAKFDLKVDLAIDEQGGGVSWSYDTSLFSEAHIEQLSTHLQQLLEALADTRGEWDIALSQLDMLSAKEVRQLVHECNARSDNATQAWGNIVSHFTAQAQRQSTQTAVVCGDSKMSYGELDRQSNQLARYLMTRHHVQRGTLVGLCMDRSIEMVVSILAILKAGGGYVPLDPHYPESRLRYMATDTGMSLLLSQQRLKSTLPDLPVEVVAVDEIAQDWQCLAATDVDVAITGSDVAYVIYTSGSTGQPKGVLTPHQGLSNFYTGFLAQGEVLSQGMGDAWLWLSSYVFDASLKGLCLLADGVKLVIPSKAQILAPLELSKLIKQHDIQVVNATPQLLGALLSEPTLPAVDVISSGDLIGAGLLKRLQQFVQKHKRVLLNAYGPTETTVNTHFAELTHSDREVIGRGMHNVSSYILSSAFELVPQGCIGELFVGGPGLALGYLNQPELTAERFVENPFYDEAQAGSSRRLYRTGDLVRYLPDGRIEFIGRVDSQVKIRGFRIELGEVEACLHAASSVASALAIVKDIAGEKQLIGYVQRQSGLDIDESSWLQALKAELQQDLPEHMIPSILIAVDEWPLTANGKVDRRALPSADVGCLQGEYVSPEGDIEQQLAGIWAQLLGIKAAEISATANFFTLGGHSLLTIRLVSEIQRCYGVDISLQQVFNAKDLRSLANDIEQSEQGQVLPAVQAYPRESQTLPTSFSQQRLWFIDHLKGGSPEYNMPVALTVKGELSLPVVERVFQRIIARHEVLRTNYYDEAGVVYQYIHEPENVAFSVVYQDLRSLQGEAQQAQIKARISEVITTAFNLAEDLLLKVLYLATGEDTGVLLFNMHHIASDGWSMQVLTNEFVRLYEAYSQGEAEPLPQLALQYGDYAQWQRTHITDTVLDKQLSYWLAQLDEAPAVHNLTLDYPRPAEKQYHGAQVVSAFSAQTADALLAAAKRHQLTPFMLLHGALSLVLSRHSNSHDIIMGTPVANRLQAELAPLIGFFVNTLVLRVNTQHDSLAEYYAHVRATHLAGQSHQDVPFEQLVEKLKVPRSRAHGPLFQIMVTTNTDYGLHEHQPLQLAGIEVAPYQSDIVQAKFDLKVDLAIDEQGGGVSWSYDTSLFSEAHIEQLSTHLQQLLEALADTRGEWDIALSQLDMLSAKEVRQLVHECNARSDNATQAWGNIVSHFTAQAQRQSTQTAVVCGDSKMSYGELDRQSNQLARYLMTRHHVQRGTLVGLCMDRSIEMVVSILAILKAGGGYVPLDPHYPESRLRYMATDTGMSLLLSQQRLKSALPDLPVEVVAVDEIAQDWQCLAATDVDVAITGSDVAYVIYTSGSTGQPKGVLTPHQGVTRLVIEQSFMTLNSDTVMMHCANIAFDAATLELWGPLLNGGQCVLYRPPYLSPAELNKELEQHNVNSLWLTAGFFREWSYHVPTVTSLRQLLAGGDSLDLDAIKRIQQIQPELTLINGYGPTENTTFSTTYTFPQAYQEERVPIGYRLDSDEIYILDGHQQLVPQGCIGELFVGGPGLAHGYLNQPELTAERFVENPFYDEAQAGSSRRLYRTGDLVRYLPDGRIEFIGRVDSQVKIRGFRIELGEVEACLHAASSVASALAIVKDIAGEKQLIGYVQRQSGLDIDESSWLQALKAELQQDLPEHMIPSILIAVDEWPLTANGKVDRRALPSADVGCLQGEYVSPEGDIEQQLTGIWAQLLGIKAAEISATANFFTLGGHSLLLVKLCNQIQAQLAVSVSFPDLYTALSLREQANAIQSKNIADRNHNSPLVFLNKSASEDKSEFLVVAIPGVLSTPNDFRSFAQTLDTHGVPCISIHHPGVFDDCESVTTIKSHGQYIFDSIRPQFKNKQIVLVGHSYGGALAQEVAECMGSIENQISLVLLDSYFAQSSYRMDMDSRLENIATWTQSLKDTELVNKLNRLAKWQSEAFFSYSPDQIWDKEVLMMFAEGSSIESCNYIELSKQWFSGPVTVEMVPGGHKSMLESPNVEQVSHGLLRYLGIQ